MTCRNQLMNEGKPYPKSGCDICGSMFDKPGGLVCTQNVLPNPPAGSNLDPKHYVKVSPPDTVKNIDYYEAIAYCAERYSIMLHTFGYKENHFEDAVLHEFVYQLMDGVADQLPLMKLNRWLGYIQGCLIERGYTTVQAERDWTRPLFKHLDFPNG